MKQTELFRRLSPHMHPDVVKVLIAMQEEITSQRQMIVKLAGLMDTMADRALALSAHVRGMEKAVLEMRPLQKRMAELGMDVKSEVIQADEP